MLCNPSCDRFHPAMRDGSAEAYACGRLRRPTSKTTVNWSIFKQGEGLLKWRVRPTNLLQCLMALASVLLGDYPSSAETLYCIYALHVVVYSNRTTVVPLWGYATYTSRLGHCAQIGTASLDGKNIWRRRSSRWFDDTLEYRSLPGSIIVLIP